MPCILARQKLPRNLVGSGGFIRHRKGSSRVLQVPGPGLVLPSLPQNMALYHLWLLCWRLLLSRDTTRQLWDFICHWETACLWPNLFVNAQAHSPAPGRARAAGPGVAGTRGRAWPPEYCPAGEITASPSPRHLRRHSLSALSHTWAVGAWRCQRCRRAARGTSGVSSGTGELRAGSSRRSTH